MSSNPHHIHLSLYPESVEKIRSALGVMATSGAVPPEETTILVDGQPDIDNLGPLPLLQAIVVPYAGVHHKTLSYVRSRPGLRLYNLHHNAHDTAEMALALLFALARHIVKLDHAIRQGRWTSDFETSSAVRLAGKTALLLGYGEIGKRIGEVLSAVGMRLLPCRRNPGPGEFGAESLDSLLPEAEVVMVSLPLTEATRGMLGKERLYRMPKGALLVNVGRGPVVDEDSLYEALTTGHLGGAGLDVWWKYPGANHAGPIWPSAHPFHLLPNVVMTPHVGGGSDASETHRMADLLALLGDILKGRAVKQVGPEGY